MRVLVFQHLDVEHPGIFRDLMRRSGWRWDVVELDRGEAIPEAACTPAGGYDLLLVMGGPMDVWEEQHHPWLVEEKIAIRRWVAELGKPYFGICLGHQLLAAALGGRVGLMAQPEVGIATVSLTEEGRADPLFAGLADEFACVQWHGAEVTALPPGVTVLARNDNCPVQAFRVGLDAYGLQFHVEISRSTAAEWGAVPAYDRALCTVMGDDALPTFSRHLEERLPAFEAMATTMFRNLAAIAQR